MTWNRIKSSNWTGTICPFLIPGLYCYLAGFSINKNPMSTTRATMA